MMSVVGPSSSSIAGSSGQRSMPPTSVPAIPSTFEFTKRKRWADLLIHELSEAIVFVLSSGCHILFCGRAVTELLGWQDSELIDTDLLQLINVDDQQGFRANFDQSLHSREELLCYIRLKCKAQYSHSPEYELPSKEVLFELKGYPHYIDGESDCRCFFAVAKPYPGRNNAILNTFLELKMENERLQQRLAELRVRGPPTNMPPGSSLSMYGAGPYVGQSMPSVTLRSAGDMPVQGYYANYQNKTSCDDLMSNPPRNNFDSLSTLAYSTMYTPPFHSTGHADPEEDTSDESAKRKKMHAAEQYVCVTCGRTDSPEWRKVSTEPNRIFSVTVDPWFPVMQGPQGPKTLCNACGLRWAKLVRTKLEEEQGGSELSNVPAP
ncbi:white collar 2 type of transcription factor [Hygrophoropsis aurantiaca]|uniref:White collar 2 type of transcription factor n=1 Tax=Hygrophoropsis aurantiaca TaxID=72124 RepID=A0ACB8APV5_9AGAM|nr:white collar 2 type of transcription factor [Hygrophoropsis aurantiaca]